jgi:hypothetical protein
LNAYLEASFDAQNRADLLELLCEARRFIDAGEQIKAMINYRLILQDRLSQDLHDIRSEAAGNLGAILVLRAMSPNPENAERGLTEAIALFAKAKAWRRTYMPNKAPVIFEVNLALAHFQRYRLFGSAGDLMLARLVMKGLRAEVEPDLQDWVSDVWQMISAPQQRT